MRWWYSGNYHKIVIVGAVSVNPGDSPKCKISDILEPNGVNNLGEKEERKDPKGRKCHGEDGLGVGPHCVSSETEEEVREREVRWPLSRYLC